ncbi:MAG: alanine racemase, partial [Verrucomicrobia bacterium]|nr:alanine racemase [Verrucomicrobiota bacterium]
MPQVPVRCATDPDLSSNELLERRSIIMRETIDRRRFLVISAAAAAMGATRLGRAGEAPTAAKPAAAPGGRALNDYLVAEISASALKANLAVVRRELKPTTKLCFVAKANCYAHGWLQCKDAITPMADWVAVATPEEAIAVRQSGWRRPLLLLMASGFPGETARERLRQLISQDVTLTLAAASDLATISAAAAEVGRSAQIHVKVDTGLSRSGVLPDAAPTLVRQARRQAGVALTGVYSHFAAADEKDKTSAHTQLARFLAVLQACGSDAEGLIRHIAASAGTIDLPESHLDMVRVGTAIYGHQPSDEMLRQLPLRGVLRLVGRLTQVKDVPAGSRVSYGGTYRFDRPAKVGLVPIGYADGYGRAFSNRAVMRIGGRAVPVRGRV